MIYRNENIRLKIYVFIQKCTKVKKIRETIVKNNLYNFFPKILMYVLNLYERFVRLINHLT